MTWRSLRRLVCYCNSHLVEVRALCSTSEMSEKLRFVSQPSMKLAIYHERNTTLWLTCVNQYMLSNLHHWIHECKWVTLLKRSPFLEHPLRYLIIQVVVERCVWVDQDTKWLGYCVAKAMLFVGKYIKLPTKLMWVNGFGNKLQESCWIQRVVSIGVEIGFEPNEP